MTAPFDPNAPNPYDFSGTIAPAESAMHTADKAFIGRNDLAMGGEPGDNVEWLKNLKKKWEPGPCHWCGQITPRRMAYTAVVHLKGRVWGIPTRNDCGCREEQAELTQGETHA